MGIKLLFLKSSTVNICTASFNLLTTVLLVRWFGETVYADFIVDLAYLSLISILLEIIPSNYSIFRVQDYPSRICGLAALSVVTVFILAGIAAASGYFFDLFHANSVWIAPYAGSLAVKRYLDTLLQSTGRLREYFGVELLGAAIRVVLMSGFLWWGVQPVDAVWASLACATLLAQLFWFSKNAEERRVFISSVVEKSAWIPLFEERRAYIPYYLGIFFKRLRDNLVPILASYFFISKASLGAFFLAYRGLLFTAGQIRVIEGLLNHRKNLVAVEGLPFLHKIFVAAFGQIVCIAASFGLMFSSGVEKFQIFTILILSFAIWFYVFSIIERSKAYSRFDISTVNLSIVSYCSVQIILVWFFKNMNIRTENVFGFILVCSEGVSLLTMVLSAKRKKLNTVK